MCLLTQISGKAIDVAHIYPFALGHPNQSHRKRMLWDTLRHFWSEAKVLAWEKAISGSLGTENVSNLRCLMTYVHCLWGTSASALKPLAASDDGKEMSVVFYWLEQALYSQDCNLQDAPTMPKDNDRVRNESFVLVDSLERLDGRRIVSGDVMTFRTENPETHPLPSYQLLEMQWFLTRDAALSGVAELVDPDYIDSDSELGDEIFAGNPEISEYGTEETNTGGGPGKLGVVAAPCARNDVNRPL
ncbi:hypothetical protein BDV19DRAFT_371441 [Aspergillus venezuelensis]